MLGSRALPRGGAEADFHGVYIFINYIINLPKYLYNSKIYRYIFIIINRLIKIRHFIPITSLNIEELIKVFIYIIYKLYSALSTIVFNKDSLFIFNF